MPFPADSNARCAFEHALVAQWIMLTEGGEEAVADEAARQLRAHAVDFSTFIDLPDDLQPGHPVASQGPARYFKQLCERFSPPVSADRPGRRQQTLYTIYRNLTGSVHPSTRTWAQYFDFDASGIRTISPSGKPDLGVSTAIAIALAAFLALDVIEELRLGQPRLPDLHALARTHGVPCDLRGDDQEPERQPQLIFDN